MAWRKKLRFNDEQMTVVAITVVKMSLLDVRLFLIYFFVYFVWRSLNYTDVVGMAKIKGSQLIGCPFVNDATVER